MILKGKASAILVLSLLSKHSCAQSSTSYQLHNADATTLIGASQSCLDAYNANVSCSTTIGSLYGNAFPDLSDDTLASLCTDDCFTSLASHRSNVAQSCSSSVQYYDSIDGSYWAATSTDDQAIYAYNMTCLQKSTGVYCNSWFQTTRNDSTTSACDQCYLETILMQADSPFGSGTDGLTSIYKSLSSSCAYSGPTPTAPSTLLVSSPTATAGCSGTTYTIKAGDTYDSVAKSQSVATVQLLQSNGLSYNASDFPQSGTLCITHQCTTHDVATNDTCDSISTAANISTFQLRTWNPNINGLCSNLGNLTGQTLCLTNPLGSDYANPTVTLSATSVTTPAPIPATVAPNVTADCGEYYQIVAGDTCAEVSEKYGLSLDDFYFLNPSIDANCTSLWLGYNYCVEPVGSISTYSGYGGSTSMPQITAASKTAVASPTLPSASLYTVIPLANGTRTDCWDYIWINDTSYAYDCWDMADANGLDPAEFALWNPSIDIYNDTSSNNTYDYSCTLKPSESYCYGLASPTAATAYTVPTPGTIGADSPANCTSWVALPTNYTCSDLLSNLDMTIAELYALNPSIKSDCSGMDPATYYCISTNSDGTPGSAPITAVTATTTGTVTATASSSGTSVTAPGPTQTGIVSNCNAFAIASAGGTCSSFATNSGITLAELYLWNTVLGSSGENCSTDFWSDYYYCTGVSSSASVSASSSGLTKSSSSTPSPTKATTTSSTASSAAPSPTQTGIISSCTSYAVANSGGTCSAFATRVGITLAQLYAWNSVLGASGEDCSTEFWSGYYYCIAVSGGSAATSLTTTSAKATTTATSSVTAPAPTQSGIPAKCNAYGTADSGSTCTLFAAKMSITLAQLYTWNPILGANGENCSSDFWAGEAYCVGVSS